MNFVFILSEKKVNTLLNNNNINRKVQICNNTKYYHEIDNLITWIIFKI